MRKKLGEILVASKALTPSDLKTALGDQTAGEPARLGDLLVSMGKITPQQLAKALSQQHAMPFIQLPKVPTEVLRVVPLALQQQHRLVPFRVGGDSVSVAVADPADVDAVEVLQRNLKKRINRYVAASDEIEALHASQMNGAVGQMHSAGAFERESRSSSNQSGLTDDIFADLNDPPVPDVAHMPAPPAIAPLANSPPPFEFPPAEALDEIDVESDPGAFDQDPFADLDLDPAPKINELSPASRQVEHAPDGESTPDLVVALGFENAGLTSSPSGTFEIPVDDAPFGGNDFGVITQPIEASRPARAPVDDFFPAMSPPQSSRSSASRAPPPVEVDANEPEGAEDMAAAAANGVLAVTPQEWTGVLDDVPPSRLIVGAVKALILKGLLTEAEVLEALRKKL
jgi:hypothetical protein